MAQILIFALSLAAFLLLIIGERLGLPAPLAARGVFLILVMAALAAAIVATTTRLARYQFGTRPAGSFGLSLLLAWSLFALAMLASGASGGTGRALAGMSAGLVLGNAMPIVNPWRADFWQFEALRVQRDTRSRPDGMRGSVNMLRWLAGTVGLLLLVRFFPAALDAFEAATNWPRPMIGWVALALLAPPLVLGGFSGVMSLGIVLMALIGVMVFAPLVIEGGQGVQQIGGSRSAIDLLENTRQFIQRDHGIRLQLSDLHALIIGAGLGFSLSMVTPAPVAWWRSAARVGAGILAGTIIALVAALAAMKLQETVSSQILGLAPARWPFFVFDDALQGWLKVCGQIPQEAADVARFCRQSGIGQPLRPELLVFDAGMNGPALALMLGWPVVLGFVWALALPLLTLITLGLFAHVASVGLAESVLFRLVHPRALKAWRLAMARLLGIAILGGLFWADRQGWRLPETQFHFFLYGWGLLAAFSIVAGWAIGVVRVFNRRRLLSAPLPADPAA